MTTKFVDTFPFLKKNLRMAEDDIGENVQRLGIIKNISSLENSGNFSPRVLLRPLLIGHTPTLFHGCLGSTSPT